ncbi:hypothetical protein KQI85_05980 [Falcatimonas sp. MSJ-15]|uniref:hypothetical protein n=1 Tax=Falcatimonas sp. MSJ-15 TaxID=2841515 RepID=UPI001C0FEEB4|nr:hypothetical protein [Falcatimonas sp. MSJ-15]MBU5469914.1 hypothetical protein [Falcatimonas sp. MSJ-15]
MKLKFRNLKASEIKPAIAKVNSEGVTILLWKNNFVDLDILDKTIESTDYQVTFSRENVCKISIWDKLKKVWVECKEIGEGISAKCTANDSLKRAGMSWGIGRELFTSGEVFRECPASKLAEYTQLSIKTVIDSLASCTNVSNIDDVEEFSI